MSNELNIQLTSKLDKPKSIAQINADIKAIEQKLSTLKLSAKLAIGTATAFTFYQPKAQKAEYLDREKP